jgi:hypothetical protein
MDSLTRGSTIADPRFRTTKLIWKCSSSATVSESEGHASSETARGSAGVEGGVGGITGAEVADGDEEVGAREQEVNRTMTNMRLTTKPL